MATTPSSREGSSPDRGADDVGSEDGAQTGPVPPADAPAEFAASESLTPGEDGRPETADRESSLAPAVGSSELPAEPFPESAGDAALVSAEAADAEMSAQTAAEHADGQTTSDEARSLAEPPASPDETAPEGTDALDDHAASASQSGDENADLSEPPLLPLEGDPDGQRAETTEQAGQQPDAFRFAPELAPAPTAEDEERGNFTEAGSDASPPDDGTSTELEGPGIAATPVAAAAATGAAASTFASHASSDDERPAPAVAPQPERGGGGGRFAAGLLGGVSALVLAGLLQYFGVLPSVGQAGQNSGNVAALQTELDGLKNQVAALSQGGTASVDPALASEVETLRTDVAQLKSGSDGTAAVPPELEARLSAAEGKIAGLDGGVSAEQLAAVAAQASAAEAAARENTNAVQAADGAAKDAAARAGTLEQNLSSVRENVSGLQGSVDEIRKQMETLQAQPRLALALAATALKQAADRGAPFTAELATLGTVAPDAPEIAQLQPYAQTGVPTREALLADWNGAADAVLAAAKPADADGGIVSRLWSGAGSLVSVRPVGAVEGTSTPAIVGRVQAAMEAGDLEKALAEYDALPEAAKQAAADFADKARARLAMERLVNEAIANATKAA